MEFEQPVGIVGGQAGGAIQVQIAAELAENSLAIGRNCVKVQHFAHLGLARWIPHHRGAATDQPQRLVAGMLQLGHGHYGDKASAMQAAGGGVEPDVKGHRSGAQKFAHGGLVGHLRDKSALTEDIESVQIHGFLQLRSARGEHDRFVIM